MDSRVGSDAKTTLAPRLQKHRNERRPQQNGASPCKLCRDLDLDSGWREGGTSFTTFTQISSSLCSSCLLLRRALEPHIETADTLLEEDTAVRPYKGRNGRLTIELFPASKAKSPVRYFPMIEVCTDEGSFCPWPSITSETFGIRSPVSAASHISQWFDACNYGHKRCQQDLSVRSLPTRVLDVSDVSKVRLRVMDEGQTGLYACLSHCWGGSPTLRTTTATYASYQQSIPLESLSKTFKDVIDLTRRVGLQHLWIDSLCIIQDDVSDWRHEGSKMASIYANSWVTFAATASANAIQGLYRPKDPEHYFKFDLSRDQASYTIYTHREQNHLPFVAGVLPLMQRAWYYQERILSPRIVSFGDTELYWECRATQCCECGDPWAQFSSAEVAIIDIKQYLRDTPYVRSRDIHQWQNLVKRYTHLNLTFESDMLPALQGIVTMWQRDVTGAYLAGLWKSYLLEGLLWRSQLFGSRLHKYRAPTWSWASIQGWVEYWSDDIEAKDKCANVLTMSTTPAGQDSKGEIVAGTLVLKGRCVPATMSYEGSNEYFRPANTITLTYGPGPPGLPVGPGEWYPDISTKSDTDADILLMEMVDLRHVTPRQMYFLGFQKVPNTKSTYERVGCARTASVGVRLVFQQRGEEKIITVI